MTEQEARAIFVAVAQTNGHPDSTGWAEAAVQNWAGPSTPHPYLAAEDRMK